MESIKITLRACTKYYDLTPSVTFCKIFKYFYSALRIAQLQKHHPSFKGREKKGNKRKRNKRKEERERKRENKIQCSSAAVARVDKKVFCN